MIQVEIDDSDQRRNEPSRSGNGIKEESHRRAMWRVEQPHNEATPWMSRSLGGVPTREDPEAAVVITDSFSNVIRHGRTCSHLTVTVT